MTQHKTIAVILLGVGVGLFLYGGIGLLLSPSSWKFIQFMVGVALLFIGYVRLQDTQDAVKKASLSLFWISVTLVTLEIILRITTPQPKFESRLPLYPHSNKLIEVSLDGISSPTRYSTNSWGLRGDEPPENWDDYLTIITVGNSTTQNYYIDDNKNWPYLLQSSLRNTKDNDCIWIGNAGLDGHSTRGNLLLMEEVIRDIRPDVIIFLVGANDLALSMSAHPPVDGNQFDAQELPFLFQSRLYRTVWQLKNIALKDVILTKNVHQNYEPIPVNEALLTPLPDDLLEMLPSLDIYRETIHQLIDIGEELGIEMVFFTQPLLFEDSQEWESVQAKDFWIREQGLVITGATWWKLLEIHNQTLLEVCEERGVHCYDLAAKIPHSREYFYDTVHFNDAGSALVSQAVFLSLQEVLDTSNNLLPDDTGNCITD